MSHTLRWVVVAALYGCGPATTAEPPPAPPIQPTEPTQPTATTPTREAERGPQQDGPGAVGVAAPPGSTASAGETNAGPSVPDAPACGPDDPCVLIGTPCGAPIAVPRSQARERSEQNERIAATVRCVQVPPVTPMVASCEAGTCREQLLDEPAWRTCQRTRDCAAVPLDCRGWTVVNRASEEAASARWCSPVACPGALPPPPQLTCAFGFCTAANQVLAP
jgi:hypothetical protein